MSATLGLAAPMEKRKQVKGKVIVNIPPDTRLVEADKGMVSGPGPYIFNVDKEIDGTSTDSVPIEFNYDLFDVGSHFSKQLYHLTCSVKVYKEFGDSEEWTLSRTGVSPVRSLNNIKIVCPPNDHSCNDGADCTKVPAWGE
ncbi:hypothetical protein I302_101720 [Kwoniella bestiolae CBS 10118]|uniref:Uncharacterized protein n=1 Tax=Kwoniella bestiolae CBS 10118 TaxID=1296100 RepID=A0A1B9GD14_9TREE|nr:hypothetical protein I302_00396 [Kwoniella bestiolae CBS 10118]OCF28906.1 hypothetical protein I302_00396 [Kwoniella bestiolae CBS 10118]